MKNNFYIIIETFFCCYYRAELIPTSKSPTGSSESGDLLLQREGLIKTYDLTLIGSSIRSELIN